jgi:hypothetical protein
MLEGIRKKRVAHVKTRHRKDTFYLRITGKFCKDNSHYMMEGIL